MQNSIALVIEVAKAKAQPQEESKPKEEPKTSEAPPRARRDEKQEKYEKHEKGEKQEKHEKGEHEKGEKHEKSGIGVMGSMIAGVLIIAFGVIIFLARWYSVPELGWPIFLVIAGIAIILFALFALTARRRSPAPPTTA